MKKVNFKSMLFGVGALALAMGLNQSIIASANVNNKTYTYTRYDMEKMLAEKNQSKYQIPAANNNSIKDLTSAKDTFDGKNYNGQQLDVWDSWAVKDQNGLPANIYGYNVVFALVGNPNKNIDNYLAGKIGVFYKKIGTKQGVDSWKYAGTLFNSKFDGAKHNNSTFKHQTGEWSGSAMLQQDGNIRLMYTSFSGSKQFGGYDDNRQTLSTAQVNLKKTKNGLIVNHKMTKDHKPIFAGDNKYYETTKETIDKYGFTLDDHSLRDPQLIVDNGHKYIIFESNTSIKDGPSGVTSLSINKYYGGNNKFMQSQKKLINSNDQLTWGDGSLQNINEAARDANGSIGIIELNNNYTVKKVLPPLVTFNLVNDELERPSIVKHNGHWYIFTTSHGFHFVSKNSGVNSSYMLGFSSKNLTSGYTPLNKYGLVAYSGIGDQDKYARNFTYSYAMNQTKNNPFVMTGYATNLGDKNDNLINHSTFAPSVKISINGNYTHVDKKLLAQGQLSNK